MSSESYIEPSQLTVIKRLGEGAFATVDLCWVTRPGQGQKLQAAVKRLKPEIFTQQEDLAAFIKEADLLRKMRHR
jgi:serine/threonine protein kinase